MERNQDADVKCTMHYNSVTDPPEQRRVESEILVQTVKTFRAALSSTRLQVGQNPPTGRSHLSHVGCPQL